MTSKKLSAKRIFSVMKTQLYQTRLLLSLCMLVLLILPVSVLTGELANKQHSDYFWESYLYSVNDVFELSTLAPLLLLALGLAVMQFGYLHKRQKLDYFHALPVLRSEHYLGRVFSAALSLLVSIIIVGIMLTASLSSIVGFKSDAIGYVWLLCGILFVVGMAVYLFVVLMLVLSATMWEAVFSFLAISAVYPAAVMFLSTIVDCSIPLSDFDPSYFATTLLSPVLFSVGVAVRLGPNMNAMSVLIRLLVVFAQIAVCAMMSMYVFCKRKSELAEIGYSGKFRMAVRFSAALLAAFMGSIGALWLTDKYVGYLFGSIAGVLLAWCVMELLYNRSLKRVLHCAVPNLVGLTVFAVMNLLVAFGFIGVMDVPKIGDVNAVSVNYICTKNEGGAITEYYNFSNGKYVYGEDDGCYVEMASFDERLVSTGLKLAELMNQNQVELYFPYHPTSWKASGIDTYEAQNESCTTNLVLYMRDGSVKQFVYHDMLSVGRMEEIFETARSIALSEDYILSDPTFLLLEKLENIVLMSNGRVADRYNVADSEKAEVIERLREAYYLDRYEATRSSKTGISSEYIDEYILTLDISEPITLRGGIIDSKYPAEGFECWLSEEFVSGVPIDEEAQSVSEADSLYFYSDDYPVTCMVLKELCGESPTE